MDAEKYGQHWAAFDLAARPIMEAVRSALVAQGLSVEEVAVTEDGDEQSLSLELQRGSKAVYVDLKLVDGDLSGFGPDPESGDVQVAVKLSVIDDEGIEHFSHLPHQYSPDLGVSTAEALMRRVFTYFEPQSIADLVNSIAVKRFRADAIVDRAVMSAVPTPDYGVSAPSM